MLIECPSGLTGNIRGLKGKEVRIFTEQRKAPGKVKPWQVLTKLIETCWESTGSLGPYESLEWGKALEGDRTYALIVLRALTFDEVFKFRVPCDNCRSWVDWEVNLLKQLPTKVLSDADRKTFAAGNRFETVFPGTDRKVVFRLPIGEDGRAVAELAKSDDAYVQGVMLSVIEVEGVERADLKKFLDDSSLGDLVKLSKDIESHDCGVETKFDIVCQDCGVPQEIQIPFGAKEFLPLS